MSISTNHAIALTRGDTLDGEKVVWRWHHNGRVQPITGYHARLVVVNSADEIVLDVDTDDLAGTRLQILTGTDGVVTPDVSATIMAGLVAGVYFYDVELTSPAGSLTTIVTRAPLTILQDAA